MTLPEERALQAIKNARQAYQAGDRHQTRYWAQVAVKLAPQMEEGWLWLAAVAPPHASLDYLKKALEINPQSKRARHGMHWAIKRLRTLEKPQPIANLAITQPVKVSQLISLAITQPVKVRPLPSQKPAPRRPLRFVYLLAPLVILLLLSAAYLTWNILPTSARYAEGIFVNNQNVEQAQLFLTKATHTPLPSPTSTATVTPTFSPTPTDTPTQIPTETPTETPPPPPSDTPPPEQPPESPPEEPPAVVDPPDYSFDDRWIDVDLTNQVTYAYEGDTLVNSFVVSTGTWEHPTVTGQYYIYVKYLSAAMAGPGYYLPDVPYIMYFYKGYGLHGTYWHANFGTPMSHGCVNLSIPDAEWLYNWADVGTLVNIHY